MSDTQLTAEPPRRVGAVVPILGVSGAVLAIAGAFLPFDDIPGAFSNIAKGNLVQHVDGYVLIAFAVGLAITAYHAYAERVRSAGPVLFSLAVLSVVVYDSAQQPPRTLSRGGPDSPDLIAATIHTSLGIAVYVAGAGAALGLLAGVIALRSKPLDLDSALDRS
jgi:hypothetical protein